MSANMEIIIGTYEEFLLGYRVEIKNDKPALVQSFADKSHSGSIRCVAVKDQWVATGATDDRIFIYDMNTRKQSQILLSHEGTINSLAFTPDGTHLLSAGDDGRMIATRLKTWFTEATWKKAHNGSTVTHVSCHPSGKLALSLGSDLVLRTWNLVKGRVAYKTNLKSRNTLGSQPDCLSWSPAGDYFTLSGQRVVEFWSIKTADVLRSEKTKSKPTSLSWIADDVCLVGLEDGKIVWLTVTSENDKETEILAHNSRVKAMYAFKQNLITASSSGEIKVWQIVKNKCKLKEIAAVNIGCRPTCLSVLDLEQFGDNYITSSTISEEVKDVKPTTSKVKAPPRGVVTIEYDNDDDDAKAKDGTDEDDDDDGNDDNDRENEVDSVAEEDNEDEDDDDDDEEEDEEDSEVDEEDSEEEEKNAEPAMRLPKSRKHKLQILKSKDNEKKKPKVENSKQKPEKKNKQNRNK